MYDASTRASSSGDSASKIGFLSYWLDDPELCTSFSADDKFPLLLLFFENKEGIASSLGRLDTFELWLSLDTAPVSDDEGECSTESMGDRVGTWWRFRSSPAANAIGGLGVTLLDSSKRVYLSLLCWIVGSETDWNGVIVLLI